VRADFVVFGAWTGFGWIEETGASFSYIIEQTNTPADGENLNLRGVLHTRGKLADTTAGFKSLALRALGPLLKKKSVTVGAFCITGTSSDPSFVF